MHFSFQGNRQIKKRCFLQVQTGFTAGIYDSWIPGRNRQINTKNKKIQAESERSL